MTIKELIYSCNNIRPGTVILLRLKTATLTFESMYDIPFLFVDRKVKKFEIYDQYAKIWVV